MAESGNSDSALFSIAAAYGESSDVDEHLSDVDRLADANSDAKSTSSDDSDSTTSTDSDDDEVCNLSAQKFNGSTRKQYRQTGAIIASSSEDDAADASDSDVDCDKPGKYSVPRTRNEVLPTELPASNENAAVPSAVNAQLRQLGKIAHILESDKFLIIEAIRDELALNDGTLLFLEGGRTLGTVFETFGPVSRPFYSVRFAPEMLGRSETHPAKSSSKKPVQQPQASPADTKDVQMNLCKESDATAASLANDQQPGASPCVDRPDSTSEQKGNDAVTEDSVMTVSESVGNQNQEDKISSEVKPAIACGMSVWYAPYNAEYTNIVFATQLLKLKGSDASWEHDEEPPPHAVDYSDDEEERRARAKLRGRDSNDAAGEHDCAGSDEDGGEGAAEHLASANNSSRGKRGRRARGGTMQRGGCADVNPFALDPSAQNRGRGGRGNRRSRGHPFRRAGFANVQDMSARHEDWQPQEMVDVSNPYYAMHHHSRFGAPSMFGAGCPVIPSHPANFNWQYANQQVANDQRNFGYSAARSNTVSSRGINATTIGGGSNSVTNGPHNVANYSSAQMLRRSLNNPSAAQNNATQAASVDMRFVENPEFM